MRKETTQKEQKPMQQKKFKTTLHLPEALWKRAKIRAIEMDMDATDLVAVAIE